MAATARHTKNTRKHPFAVYESYSFTDKDPIIDTCQTVFQDSGLTYKQVHERSGVSTHTMYQWFGGTTRRPQFATVMAFVRACGKDLAIVEPQRSRPKLRVVAGGR